MVGRLRLYLLLFGLQTLGFVVVAWNGLPLYRELVGDPSAYGDREETLIWALSAIVLMQAGYWIRHRLRPVMPRAINVLLGHIVLFVGRLEFTLATAIFSFVYITQKLGNLSAGRDALTLSVLFSLFLYMQELQLLGRHLCGSDRVTTTN